MLRNQIKNIYFRLPKDPVFAEQWKSVISQNVTAPTIPYALEKGLICAEHFEQTAFKRKNKCELKKGSIPSIFQAFPQSTVAIDTTIATASTDTVAADKIDATVANASTSITIAADANAISNEETICIQCEKKDDIIAYQKRIIENLRVKVKRVNDKAYYLGKTKEAMSASLLKIKNEKLVDDNLYRQLQVALTSFLYLLHYVPLLYHCCKIARIHFRSYRTTSGYMFCVSD